MAELTIDTPADDGQYAHIARVLRRPELVDKISVQWTIFSRPIPFDGFFHSCRKRRTWTPPLLATEPVCLHTK